MGCSRDHQAEIDIYNKPYKEKINRIKIMKDQGNQAIGEYNKRS